METTLLIVDDEVEIINVLEGFFVLHDFKVLTAKSSAEALNILNKNKIQIALLDINMPKMGGIDLLREIKKIDFSIQIIMMTGYPSFDKTIQSLERGAVDYILKPFDNLDEFLELINDSVNRISRWQKNLSKSVMKT